MPHILADFTTDMHLANLSERTITGRISVLKILASHISPTPLLNVTEKQLQAWQRSLSIYAPATIDLYTRHVQAFFRWADARRLVEADPSRRLITTKVRRGRPHPATVDELRTIFTCTTGPLRLVYALATFAGLRCMEICNLQEHDIITDALTPYLIAHGKGEKQRNVPLVQPLVGEIHDYGLPRAGHLVLCRDGRPYYPNRLSADSSRWLQQLRVRTTLHSMRHAFATTAYQTTRDLLLVAELLGHSSVSTTQVYAAPDMSHAGERLAGVAELASGVLSPQRRLLHAVR